MSMIQTLRRVFVDAHGEFQKSPAMRWLTSGSMSTNRHREYPRQTYRPTARDPAAPPGRSPIPPATMPRRPNAIQQRIAGSLIGQCLGDALGFVVEGTSREGCLAYVDDCLMTDLAGSIGRPGFPFGQYTDDSQLARELAESLVACGGFDPEDYAARIAAIFAEKRIVGWGQSTRAAALRLRRGVDWREAGTPAPAAGNGGAMRAAPIGWIHAADDPVLVRAACDQTRITHADPRSQAGAAMIAQAVAIAMEPGPLDPEALIGRLASTADRVAPSIGSAVRSLREFLPLPPDEAHRSIGALGQTPEERAADDWAGTISPFVAPSVVWALYSVLRTPDDYWATICTAIGGGGDADTTAAMAGAISGARLGLEGIPEALAQKVNDRGTWQYDDLVALSRRIAELAAR